MPREWVGGCLTPPFFITDRDEPYRAAFVVWMDARDGLVVGQDVVAPGNTPGALGRALLAAMERPLAGPPGRPDRIRVADATLAADVRAALGHAIPIDVAPTPELDALLHAMLGWMSENDDDEDDESYLEDGRVPPEAVAELFQAAELLYTVAPWELATDDQVLRMDIPALGVEGACVAIIGNLGESLGALIFPSLAGYEGFVRAADRGLPASGPLDFGSNWLALNFERGAELPARMRREAAEHGWPVADANAYPRVQRCERDGALRPLVERDVRIASACARSLVACFVKHRDRFEADDIEPVCESWFDRDDLEVRFTLPYEAFPLFDTEHGAAQPPRASKKIGRNEPCPCGSGRKYKKCHLAADEAERASARERHRVDDLDDELTFVLHEYAMRHFGFEWRVGFEDDFIDLADARQLAVPWSLYHSTVRGQTILEWYLEEHGRKLPQLERGWLAAQQAAWLSVWEVIAVEPGQTVTLRDLLSWEERCVREATASQTLVLRDALLGRVVEYDDVSLLCGLYPRALPPLYAADLVRRARGRLRRKRAVPVERLRDEAFGRYLIRRWEEAVEERDLRASVPPELQNTDGDPFLFTTDHFALEPATRAEVERRLAGMEGVQAEGGDDHAGPDGSAYVFFAPGDRAQMSPMNTVIGRASLSRAALRLETNSRERADALRERVETACAGLLRHRAREHADPLSEPARAAATASPPEPPPPEAEQLVLEFKQRHYADWPDHPLPALGGETPREAVRTARGRSAVDVLLKDLENHEQRSSGAHAFDFGHLRRELGLE